MEKRKLKSLSGKSAARELSQTKKTVRSVTLTGPKKYVSMIKAKADEFGPTPRKKRGTVADTRENTKQLTQVLFNMQKELDNWSEAYYVNSEPLVSDAQFDKALVAHDKLAGKLGEAPYKFKSDHISGFKQVAHLTRVLSIKDTFAFDEAIHEVTRIDEAGYRETDGSEKGEVDVQHVPVFSIEDKIDGCSVVLVYSNGELQYAATRGDGDRGDDVTDNLLAIGIKKHLPLNGTVEVRGEFCFTKSQFDKLNAERVQQGKSPYKNPRNLASGTLKLHDPKEVARRAPTLVIFNVDPDDGHLTNEHMAELQGCCAVTQHVVGVRGEVIHYLEQHLTKPETDLPIDGWVIKVLDRNIRKLLGETGSIVKWATAYKFPEDVATTKVIGIEMHPGRSGALVPVAVLEPVELNGTTVQRGTCHSVGEMIEKKIHVGATVTLKKGGEIIPYLISSDGKASVARKYARSLKCPICGSKAVLEEPHAFCRNKACSGKALSEAMYIFGRAVLNVKGLGGATLSALFATGSIETAWDMYTLTEKDFEKAGVSPKVAAKIIKNLEDSIERSPHLFLAAANIPNLGRTDSKTLLEKYGSIQALIGARAEDIRKLPGIDSKADFYEEVFSSTAFAEFVHRIPEKVADRKVEDASSDTVGLKTVCITGKLANMSKRDFVLKHLPGYVHQESINKNLDLVIMAEGYENSTKAKRAKKLGLVVKSSSEF